MEITHRILLASFAAAVLYLAGLLSGHGITIPATTLGGIGTFVLGVLAAIS